MALDLNAAMRKVFTDHAVGTSNLIMDSLPTLNPEAAKADTKRILENPADIASLIGEFFDKKLSNTIETVFTDHLKLAAATLKPARLGDKRAVNVSAKEFYGQGVQVGKALGMINVQFFPPETAISEMAVHNNFVVSLVKLRASERYEEYIDTYELYYAHLLKLADRITIAIKNVTD
jgi:hypothetical protein